MIIDTRWTKQHYRGESECVVPEGATVIGHVAFGAFANLEKVTLPDSLTEIKPCAFYCCSNLKEINFPNGLKTIGEGTFDHCISLSDITIPDSVEKIGNRTFYNCSDSFKIHCSSDSYAAEYAEKNNIKCEYTDVLDLTQEQNCGRK